MFFTSILGPLGTWAVAILAVVMLCGLSFLKGMAYEGDKRLIEEAKAEAERKVFVRVVEREVIKIEVKYIEKKTKREQQYTGSIAEVMDHAKTIPDPVACWLDTRRVSVINKSWGVGPSTDQPQQTPTVPSTKPPTVGKPSGSGKVGS